MERDFPFAGRACCRSLRFAVRAPCAWPGERLVYVFTVFIWFFGTDDRGLSGMAKAWTTQESSHLVELLGNSHARVCLTVVFGCTSHYRQLHDEGVDSACHR